ncbi:hypothetical protein CDAR_315571 [Caerostris darwini]|uniref:Uncharacterized protein n=1 Tax=Caerostris darwini TaxID=1538125 RepID=A0AAV4TMJ7_9ARAC|nr:hypothetical protein CDAR_315571 [Caerostris darwini]
MPRMHGFTATGVQPFNPQGLGHLRPWIFDCSVELCASSPFPALWPEPMNPTAHVPVAMPPACDGFSGKKCWVSPPLWVERLATPSFL